jgi:hypothetical protein
MAERGHHWTEKAAALLFVLLCFEIGVFLMVFPWVPAWSRSWFSNLDVTLWGRPWEAVWDSSWFRGAVSGIGVMNVLISLVEVGRLRRFARPREVEVVESGSR